MFSYLLLGKPDTMVRFQLEAEAKVDYTIEGNCFSYVITLEDDLEHLITREVLLTAGVHTGKIIFHTSFTKCPNVYKHYSVGTEWYNKILQNNNLTSLIGTLKGYKLLLPKNIDFIEGSQRIGTHILDLILSSNVQLLLQLVNLHTITELSIKEEEIDFETPINFNEEYEEA